MKPFAVFEDRRSLDVSDLAIEEYDFVKILIDSFEPGLIKARLAEILWLNPDHKRVDYALAAIEGYQVVLLNGDSWWGGGKECWDRAISLARGLGKSGRVILVQLTDLLFDALALEFKSLSELFPHLADSVLEHRLVHSQAADLPEKLETAGRGYERDGQLIRARHCFELGAQAYSMAKDRLASARMVVAEAQTWITEARLREGGSVAQPLIAMNHLAKALQIFRKVPQAFRDQLGITQVYEQLRSQIAEAGSLTVQTMYTISTGPIDITNLATMALEETTGKSALTALRALTTKLPFASWQEARTRALRTLQVGLISALTEFTLVDQNGRVIAKAPGMSMSTLPTPSDEERIWAQMVQGHELTRNVAVEGWIFPVLQVIQREHCFREQDLINLAKVSALVPPERALMVGKGLYWGMVGEFAMAAHFLIPQLENIVRHHMKEAGMNTSNTDRNDIVNENGLSTLLDVEGVEDVFGPNLLFELKALFCSPFGPNLRNEFAHGLMNDGDFYSPSVVYAWWFILKWVAMPYWRALELHEESGNVDTTAAPNPDEPGMAT
ncbi:DUF4209 domain-containing protein [Pseudomonas sp. NKUCC02_KPG]|uniref:DUF4209 domain-containing protein n=1 Tax=Pseudomonas sp. NKUCC02_KPG TaxID=2842124 RepID=UPI001C5B1686|nr:DUF4209 domain-containing protein [Pseudomonas sp. NKUCC02_KPG]MBW3504671.1 DUF4209 domain-containing protein [Pseudomonas sp. NKUCC02_KPG]